MNKEEFKAYLKIANINKVELSNALGMEYNTVNAWGNNSRPYPIWLKSWLELYIDNKNCKELKSMIKNSGICD